MTPFRSPGDTAVVRFVAHNRVRVAQPSIVVSDSAEETVLLLLPGAQCQIPESIWRAPGTDYDHSARWAEETSGAYTLREHRWHSNRFLQVLRPHWFYSVIHIWDHASGQFSCYYVNFQLPFKRSHCGFDTYDLELDLVVNPDFSTEWKDEDAYKDGIAKGNISPDWVASIERATADVLADIAARVNPFDGRWLSYQPDPTWHAPDLPADWNVLD